MYKISTKLTSLHQCNIDYVEHTKITSTLSNMACELGRKAWLRSDTIHVKSYQNIMCAILSLSVQH